MICGDAPITITGVTGGGSGNPVTFISSNTSVATVSGNVVTIIGVGTADITASQAGDATYSDALDVIQTLTVDSIPQTVDVQVACDSFMWNNGVTYYTSVSNVRDTIITASGCDSIVRLDLTIHNSDSTFFIANSCYSYTWNGCLLYTSPSPRDA